MHGMEHAWNGAQYKAVKEFYNIAVNSLKTVSHTELVETLFEASRKTKNLRI